MRIPVLLVFSLSIAIAAACSSSGTAPNTPVALKSVTIIGGNLQTAPAGATLPDSIVVVATDSNGNPADHVAVAYGPSGIGSTPSPSVYTSTSGRAATTWTLDTTAGQQNMLIAAQDPAHANHVVVITAFATATAH